MPSISSCPACHRDLTLPDLEPLQKRLRCPLCDAQFAAEEVLADSVKFPPMAIIVEPALSAVEPSATSDEETPQYSMDDELSAAVGAVPESSRTQEPDEINPRSPAMRMNGTVSPDATDHEPAVTASEPAQALVDQETAADYEAFGQQVTAMRVAPRSKRQTGLLGILGQVLGMALGGVLGLAIGYYVLIWLGGAQADFLELRGKLPQWLVPPARRHHVPGGLAPQADKAGPKADAARALVDVLGQADRPAAVPPEEIKTHDAELSSVMAADKGGRNDGRADPPTHIEPALTERFGVVPKPLPDDYRGPRGFKLRTAAELEAAIEETDLALRCPHCQAPGAVRLASFDSTGDHPVAEAAARPCDYCRGKPVLNLNAAGFEQLCDLAEAAAYVQFDGDDERRDGLRQAAESILSAIGGQRDKCEIVGRLAGARLDDGGRQTNGIALAGTVQAAHAEGGFFALQIMLLGCGKSVTVISREPPEPPLARRDHLIVLGSIVDSPAENLVGYSGHAAQVIWGGLHLKLVE